MPRKERGHQLNVELNASGWALWQVVKSKFPSDYPNFRVIEAIFEHFIDPNYAPTLELDFSEPEPPNPPSALAKKAPRDRKHWQIKLW